MYRNKEIKQRFAFFKELLNKRKIVKSSPIILVPKRSNHYWMIGSTDVEHETISEAVSLDVEKSKRERKYGIKLKCENLSKEPFFRFDSDGPAHRNEDPDKPINEQKVDTPHFNTFNEDGVSIAYRTEQLEAEEHRREVESDINFGIAHFCNETNMCLKDNSFPEVKDSIPELKLVESPTIDFNGVKFV